MPIGPTELIILLVIILIVFGVGRLPEIGGALGRGIKEFKHAQSELEDVKTDLKQSVSLDSQNETEKQKTSA